MFDFLFQNKQCDNADDALVQCISALKGLTIDDRIKVINGLSGYYGLSASSGNRTGGHSGGTGVKSSRKGKGPSREDRVQGPQPSDQRKIAKLRAVARAKEMELLAYRAGKTLTSLETDPVYKQMGRDLQAAQQALGKLRKELGLKKNPASRARERKSAGGSSSKPQTEVPGPSSETAE